MQVSVDAYGDVQIGERNGAHLDSSLLDWLTDDEYKALIHRLGFNPPTTCPACNGVGYILQPHHAGRGNGQGPMTLDLVGCIYPTCEVPHREIATLGVLGQFTEVVHHPATGSVMALTGFTQPEFR